jgi:hypothetical protein
LYGPGKTHGYPQGKPGRGALPGFQGKNQGPVEAYCLNAARSPVPLQDPRVKTIPGLFFEYLEEVYGPFIPPGQGLSQLMGLKKDKVHPLGIPQKGREA